MGWFKKDISEGVKMLVANIESEPNNWVQGRYEFYSIHSDDIRIWTANGWKFIKFNGNDGLTNDEKKLINIAIKKAIALKVTNTA